MKRKSKPVVIRDLIRSFPLTIWINALNILVTVFLQFLLDEEELLLMGSHIERIEDKVKRLRTRRV